MPRFLSLDDADWKGKRVLVRCDLNSSVNEKGEVKSSERIAGHARTIRELSDDGARVVVLAHQGRRGDPDFISLLPHAEMLSKFVGKPVKFVADVIGPQALEAIAALKDGDILLLDNVRLLSEETEDKTPEVHAKGQLVKTLAPLFDAFVLDAFSAAHRSHASIVGFTYVLPSYSGRVMEEEVSALSKASENPARPLYLVAGGAKADDSMKMVSFWLRSNLADKVLVGGVLANVFLAGQHRDLGQKSIDYLKSKGYDKLQREAANLMGDYGSKIDIPLDVGYDKFGQRDDVDVSDLPVPGPILDIGYMTGFKYAQELKNAKTIVMNGPMGVYEDEKYLKGTKAVLEAITASKAYSLLGGGNTLDAIKRCGLDEKKIGYCSLAGKAFVEFVMGKRLPGVEALEAAAKKQEKD